MEGDQVHFYNLVRIVHFNPLPPHGGRQITCFAADVMYSFQSTPSAWRETRYCLILIGSNPYFNPLPPHGGRLYSL